MIVHSKVGSTNVIHVIALKHMGKKKKERKSNWDLQMTRLSSSHFPNLTQPALLYFKAHNKIKSRALPHFLGI